MDNTASKNQAVCQVLQFPTRQRAAAVQQGDLKQTEALLNQAAANGRLALAHFATCRDAIDWARTFRDRCATAVDNANLDEMIRERDALAQDWAERCTVALQGS